MINLITPKRIRDSWGEGHYGAKRKDRLHLGVDYAAYPGSIVLSPVKGIITKIGYPYSPLDKKKGWARYIEIKLYHDFKVRLFYIKPYVEVSQVVSHGTPLGEVQDLTKVYRGMTPHIHLEVKDPKGNYLDPAELLRPEYPDGF